MTRKGRNLVFRWTDNEGRTRERASEFPPSRKSRKLAERAAQNLEQELNDQGSEITWADFQRRYEQEHLSALSEASQSKWTTVASKLTDIVGPQFVDEITTESLSKFATRLRSDGAAEPTIAGYLRQLCAGLSWGCQLGIIDDMPKYKATRRARGKRRSIRDRAITVEEFERIEKVAGPKHKLFLASLFWGSLRLSEAVNLTWHRSPFCVDLSGRRPLFRILCESEKGHKDRLLPIAPEFAALLLQHKQPRGHVGKTGVKRTMQEQIKSWATKANVLVNETKVASAQDFRRAFGTRWAKLLMPAQLQQLMRHESIETTMQFYVRLDADDLAESLYQSKSDIFGDMGQSQPQLHDTNNQVAKEQKS